MTEKNHIRAARCKLVQTDDLIWFGAVFPKREILYEDRVLDFASSWDEVVDSFHRQIDCGLSRPLIVKHHGFDNWEGLGVVVSTKIITAEEAADLNLSAEVDGIYLGVKEIQKGSLKGVQYVSLGMRFDVVDETGEKWPVFVDEVTATATPHIAIDQTPSMLLNEVLGGNMEKEKEIDEVLPEEKAEEAEAQMADSPQDEDPIAVLEAKLAAANELIKSLEEQLDDLKSESELQDDLAEGALEVDEKQFAALRRLHKVDKDVVKVISSILMTNMKEGKDKEKDVHLTSRPRQSVGHSTTPLTQLQELEILRQRRAAGLTGAAAHEGFNYNEVK